MTIVKILWYNGHMVNKNWSLDGRVCKSCQEFKPLSEYNLRKSGTPYTLCRPCYAADVKIRGAKKQKLPSDALRTCTDCNEEKIILDFPLNTNSSGGYLNRCKRCYAKRNSIAKWGIDVTDYDYCVICKRDLVPGREKVVDHDHNCCPGQKTCGSCVRGVLCGPCNRALGLFGDNPATLIQAASYLMGDSWVALESGKDGGPIYPFRADWT